MEENNIKPEFIQLIESFCHELRTEQNVSSHTLRNYRLDLLDYGRWAQRAQVDPLSPSHKQLRRYLAELDKARYSRSTINRRLSSLRSFFGWTSITGRTQQNPDDVLMSLKKDKTLPHTISSNDMKRILSVYAPISDTGEMRERTPSEIRNQAILEFLYASGARISEVSSLRLACIDYEQSQVRVFGKGSKERIIPVHKLALEAMSLYQHDARPLLLEGKPASEFFFVSTRGNQMSTDSIRKMFNATLKRAGISAKYTPHDMRHTFASDVLSGGADLRSVQEMLGHSSLSTTQIYTHLSAERLKTIHSQSHPRG